MTKAVRIDPKSSPPPFPTKIKTPAGSFTIVRVDQEQPFLIHDDTGYITLDDKLDYAAKRQTLWEIIEAFPEYTLRLLRNNPKLVQYFMWTGDEK